MKKRMLKTLVATTVLVALAASPALAEPLLDQEQGTIDSYATTMNMPVVYQTFTAGRSGTLDRVSVYAGCCYQDHPDYYTMPLPLYLEIKGPGVDTAAVEVPVDVSFWYSVTSGWMDVALDPAPYLKAGEQYKLWLTTDSYAGPSFHTLGHATSDVYAGGEFHFGACCTEDGYQWTTMSDWDLAFRTYVTPDATAPRVVSTRPYNGKTDVGRGTDLTATFSEPMDPATVGATTFKLFRVGADGTTTRVSAGAPITLSADGLTATLDPFGETTNRLAPNARYKAVITAGARDLAGNALDQNAATAGAQQKAWYFTTGSR